MSAETLVAKRYAKALLEIAREQGSIPAVREQLAAISQSFTDNPELRTLLGHPAFDKAKKQALMKELFQGKVAPEVYNLLQVLVENGREQGIGEVYRQYTALANQATGQAEAIVYSAYPLSEQEQSAISATFGKRSGKTLEVSNVVDSSLLGGIKVKVGDRMYDGTVSGKLEQLSKQLK